MSRLEKEPVSRLEKELWAAHICTAVGVGLWVYIILAAFFQECK